MLKTRGAIVSVASILEQVGLAQAPAYAAAKHGVMGLTEVAAMDNASFVTGAYYPVDGGYLA